YQHGVSGTGYREGTDSLGANSAQLVQKNVGGLSGRRGEAARQHDRTATGLVQGARKREDRPGKTWKALTLAARLKFDRGCYRHMVGRAFCAAIIFRDS